MGENIPDHVTILPSNIEYLEHSYTSKLLPSSQISNPITISEQTSNPQRIFNSTTRSEACSDPNFVSNTHIQSVNVTSSQETAIKNCIRLLPAFKIIVVKGESSSGKYTVANEVFRRTGAFVENFDLCELAQQTKLEVSNQHVIEYMKTLLHKLQTRMSYSANSDVDPFIKSSSSDPFIKSSSSDPFTKRRKLSPENQNNLLEFGKNTTSSLHSTRSELCLTESNPQEILDPTSLYSLLDAPFNNKDLSISSKTEDKELLLHNVDLKKSSNSTRQIRDNDESENSQRDVGSTFKETHCGSDYVKESSDLAVGNNMGIIYIRHYNRIADVLTDCYAKVRFLLSLILKTFTETMPHNIRIMITTQGCMLPEGLHWCVDLNTTHKDMDQILIPYVGRNIITRKEKDHILKISKTIPVGRLLHCLRYAIAMSDPLLSGNNLNFSEQEKISFVESFRKALGRFSGSTVDIERDVPKPVPEDDLVGVEEIIEAITISIITPMKLGISGIPMKKGLLLCGPPGTGKTSIGRWLAHQIKGKFYLIGGEAGINGPSLIDTFELTVRKARENAPAVIFVDDCDVMFEHDDTYRAFLTILDGIETNKREGVCVVLTCMNLRNIPSSLLRGGRLEMTLITKLPDRKKIQTILQRSLNKMCQTLTEYDETIGNEISNRVNIDFITNLSHRMCGWNCADIHRCVNDVLRLVVSRKRVDITEMFQKCIRQIQEQYTLCGKCESTNLDDRPHDAYIM